MPVAESATKQWLESRSAEATRRMRENFEKVGEAAKKLKGAFETRAARTAKGGTVGTEWNAANFPDSAAMREYAAKHQENADAVAKATQATNTATSALSSLRGAANSAASSLNSLSAKIADWHPPMLPPAVAAPVPIAPHQKGGIAIRPHIGLIGEAGPEAIMPLDKAKPGLLGGSVTINAPITISGPVADSGNLAAVLSEHVHAIAREVQRILQIEYEQEAVV
jgi:hypothetical protein